MADFDPREHDFLCVVSEWQSYNRKGGLLGNAYPLFCLTTGKIVEAPLTVFPNPGYVFLLGRDNCQTWDFVRIRPSMNERYMNENPRECYFLCHGGPRVVAEPQDHLGVASVLEVGEFHAAHPSFEIQDPGQNVTPLFFVRCGNRHYGPMLREEVVRDYDRVKRIGWSCASPDFVLFELSDEDLSRCGVQQQTYRHPQSELNEVIESPIRLLVGPVDKLSSATSFDLLPDDELARWYMRWARIVDAQLESFATVFRAGVAALSDGEQQFIKNRIARLSSLLGTADLLREERQRVASQFLQSPEGKKAVQLVVGQEVERGAKEIRQQVEDKGKELAARRVQMEGELSKVEEELAQKKGSLQSECDTLAAEKDSLTTCIDDLQSHLVRSAEDLGERIRAASPLVAAFAANRLGGPPAHAGDFSSASKKVAPWYDVEPIAPTADLAPISDEAQYVGLLREKLAMNGVGFTAEFVANIYACMKSSSLLLIAGPPGYGKSSLVRSLATVLGHKNALLEVPVRRSWSDDRYLLGFYDTFHGRYDPGPTGLAPHLFRAQRDWEGSKEGVYFVLLDEFNLAAPEYYFSQLMQVLSRDSESREVRLFDLVQETDEPSRVRVYPNVRFWGTVNYDETTERLSPRLLDRTGIIYLTRGDCLPELLTEATLPAKSLKGVSATGLFEDCVRQPGDCPEESWDLFAKAVEPLGKSSDEFGPGVSLSPRVRLAVRVYLANAQTLLAPRTAADFAFQQRVLPLIRGRGPQFDKRIERLLNGLEEQGLTRSAAHVRESNRLASSAFGEIDFFAY